jgi:hypothetical protein
MGRKRRMFQASMGAREGRGETSEEAAPRPRDCPAVMPRNTKSHVQQISNWFVYI